MQSSLTDLLSLAQDTAVDAGKQARQLLSQPRKTYSKGFRDLVTDADMAAQKIITDAILNQFPDHGFLPEEKDSKLPTEGSVIWIIDPIDGTTNYSRGQTNFCVSVAAALPEYDSNSKVYGYQSLAGAIYDPIREELFSAAKGEGAFLQSKRSGKAQIKVSDIDKMEDTLLLLDIPGSIQFRQTAVNTINQLAAKVYTFRNLGSATMALAWLAAGRADAYFNVRVRPWDLAAAQIILEEAGGTLTSLQGDALNWVGKGMSCLGSNGRVHTQILEQLAT